MAYVQTVDFKLVSPEGTPGAKFCFSVVDRKDLRALRDQRWDLVSRILEPGRGTRW